MKKLLMALVATVALVVNAQLPIQEDTLRITTMNGIKHNYLFNFVKSLDFSDNSMVTVNFHDDTSDKYALNDVYSIRFYNRWSNPDALLKAQNTGAYEGLFRASEDALALSYFVSCLASDETLGGGGYQDRYYHGVDLFVADAYPRDDVWNVYYKAIANVNDMIARLQFLPTDVKISDVDHAHGEALFLRAYYYSQLASIFGPVPVVVNNSWEEKLSVATAQTTWGQIMLDLKNAISLMDGYSPTLTIDDSRVGKYAAEALLARSFLFYTGFYMGIHDIAAENEVSVVLPDGSAMTKSDVIAYVNDCVDHSGFSLVKDFRNLWPYTNRLTVEDYDYTKGQGLKWVEDDGGVNPEVLFKIKYSTLASWGTSVGYANRVALYMGMRSYEDYALEATFPFGHGWGAGTVSSAFYRDWAEREPNDMRRKASIQYLYELPQYATDAWNDAVQLTPYHEKKNSPITCKKGENSYSPTFEMVMFGANESYQLGNIHPLNIIRFADVLLMQSELTGSVEGMNKVRERAGLSPIVAYSLAALQDERRWELAFEGVRWNDMRRWGDDYCMAALDKQMGIDVYCRGRLTTNPRDVLEYENYPTPYSQRYAVNHGFFALPTIQKMEGGAAIAAMQGEWTYQDDELMLDYIVISNDEVVRYDGDNQRVARGWLSVTKTDDYNHLICTVKFTNGSMLPMSKNGADNDGTQQYSLTSLDENTMTLTCGEQSLTLRRPGYEEQMLRAVAGTQWSYAIYKSYDYNTDSYVTVGPYGITSWNSDLPQNGYLTFTYMPHLQSVTDTDLRTYLTRKGIDVTNGEADPFAYMTISMKDKKIRKYTPGGSLISEKAFTAKLDDGGQVFITTEPDATLVPYLFNDTSRKEVSFLVKSHPDQGYFVSVDPGLVLISTTEVDNVKTYWMFGRRGLTNEELDAKLTVTQENQDGIVSSTGRFLRASLDLPYDYSTYRYLTCEFEDGTEVPQAYVETGADAACVYRIKGRLGETLTKKLRFRFKNCNQTEAVVERTFNIYIDKLIKTWIYGEDPSTEPPFVPGAWDAAAMRFSYTEGMYLPTLSDEVYFDLKTLIFDVSDVSNDFNMRIMNGWWSNTYYDNVKWESGLNEVQITETMAKECAKGGQGRDLDLMLYSGTCTINGVYYED